MYEITISENGLRLTHGNSSEFYPTFSKPPVSVNRDELDDLAPNLKELRDNNRTFCQDSLSALKTISLALISLSILGNSFLTTPVSDPVEPDIIDALVKKDSRKEVF